MTHSGAPWYDCPAAVDSLQIFQQKLQQVRQLFTQYAELLGDFGALPENACQKNVFIQNDEIWLESARVTYRRIEKKTAVTNQLKRSNKCSRSRRRAANGSKRMYLDYTHGLFIT